MSILLCDRLMHKCPVGIVKLVTSHRLETIEHPFECDTPSSKYTNVLFVIDYEIYVNEVNLYK